MTLWHWKTPALFSVIVLTTLRWHWIWTIWTYSLANFLSILAVDMYNSNYWKRERFYYKIGCFHKIRLNFLKKSSFLAKSINFGWNLKIFQKLDLYLSTASIDKKANEYVHIVHIQCNSSVDNTMTLNNTGIFQCCSIMPVFFRPSTHSY